MNRAETEALLVGKTISKIDLVESEIWPMVIQAIHFTDGTIAQLGGNADYARVEWVTLPDGAVVIPVELDPEV